MKKLMLIVLACTMSLVCILSMSACAAGEKPELDIREAKKNLEEMDYSVEIIKGRDLGADDIGLPLPAEIGVTVSDAAVEEVLMAVNNYGHSDSTGLQIIYFKEQKFAKTFYEYLNSYLKSGIEAYEKNKELLEFVLKNYEKDLSSGQINDLQDSIKEVEKEIKLLKENRVIGRSGKVVWLGDATAVKDSKA